MPSLRTSTVPQQVAEYLRKELVRGRWIDKMPGRDLLATELGVSPRSVQVALKILEMEGLLTPQGPGRPSRIAGSNHCAAPALRVAVLTFDRASRGNDHQIELRHQIEEAGHVPVYFDKGLQELGMSPSRVARLVHRTKADVWVVVAASREVLEWFVERDIAVFALAGRRQSLPIPGTGPNKVPIYAEAARRLIALGHRRISLLCFRNLRLPDPSRSSRAFLHELQAAGIATGAFNLPDWEESQDGFLRMLDSLFAHTPPTALILDEPFLFHAAYHYFASRRIQVPQDVSMICTDPDPTFAWCKPSVAHFGWDYRPVVRRIIRWINNVARGKTDTSPRSTKAELVDGGTMGRAPGC